MWWWRSGGREIKRNSLPISTWEATRSSRGLAETPKVETEGMGAAARSGGASIPPTGGRSKRRRKV